MPIKLIHFHMKIFARGLGIKMAFCRWWAPAFWHCKLGTIRIRCFESDHCVVYALTLTRRVVQCPASLSFFQFKMMVYFNLILTLELYFSRLNKGLDSLLIVIPQEWKTMLIDAGMSATVNWIRTTCNRKQFTVLCSFSSASVLQLRI